MNILGMKNYKTVIMDGSNKRTVDEITSIFEMMLGRKFRRIKTKPIDKDHPTMLSFEVFARANDYHDVRRLINKTYPGLCVFDVNM